MSHPRINESGAGDIVLKRVEGWIHKKGGAVKGSALSAMKNWKKRYFYLQDAGAGGGALKLYELKYFDKPNGSLKGTVKLKGTEVYCDGTHQGSAKNKKFEFQILLSNGSMLKLYCDVLKEREEWVETLNYVITEMKVKPAQRHQKKQSLKNATYDEMVEMLAYNPANEDDMGDYEAGKDLATACQAFGSGLFGAEAGQNAQFMVQSYSSTGEMLDGGGLPFSISLVDDECLYHIMSHDNDDGTYSAFYSISRPGKYKLHVKLNDIHHIAGSPFDVEILPSYTVAGICSGSGQCLSLIQPDTPSVFTITAMDGLGNRKKRGGDPFEIGVMGPAVLHGLTDNNDGTYECVIEAKQPSMVDYVTSASLSIMVTLHGKHIGGSPFRPVIDTKVEVRNHQWDGSSSKIKQGRVDDRQGYSIDAPPVSRRNKGGSAASRATAISQQINSGMTDSTNYFNTPSKTNQQPPLTHQDLLATLDTANASMSKLEQARQRALQRSQNTTIGTSGTPSKAANANVFVDESPPPPPPPMDSPPKQSRRASTRSGPSNSSSVKERMSKLDLMTKKFGESTLSKSMQCSSGAPSMKPKRLHDKHQESSSSASHSDLVTSLGAGLNQTSAPDDLSNENRRVWGITDDALRSADVLTTISSNVAGMEKCFHLAADQDIAFLSPTDNGVGLYKLFEEFDVIPAYISKKELKGLFGLVIRAHAFETGKRLIGQNGKDAISFTSFLKLLVMSALHCLSKTSSFNSLYPTVKAKLDVMLFNWGFADPLKIRSVAHRVGR